MTKTARSLGRSSPSQTRQAAAARARKGKAVTRPVMIRWAVSCSTGWMSRDTGATAAAQRSPAAVWQVKEAPGGAFTFTAPNATKTVRVAPAQGCALYPEADLNATGTPAPGATSYGRVGGLVEGHMHWMTYEYL